VSSLTFIKQMEKPAVSVKHLIHRKLAGMEPARPHFPLRASTLLKSGYEFCPREHALMDLQQGAPKAQFVGTSLRYTFDHGKDAEKRVRNVYLRQEAIGHWKCRVCKHIDSAFGHCPDPKPCPKCGFKYHWEYMEPEFDHPTTAVQCHIDALIKFPEKPKLHLVELKTMAGDEFKKLMAPLAEHKLRTSLYLQMVAESEWEGKQRVDTSEASILYISKAFGCKDEDLAKHKVKDAPFSPFKEFNVKRDDKLNAKTMARARVLKIWRDTGSDVKALPAGICKSTMDPRAKQCPTCVSCYGGKFPGTLTWPENGTAKHPGKTLVT
jgi:hypothetical protein